MERDQYSIMVTAEKHRSIMKHVICFGGDPNNGTGEIDKTLKENGIKDIPDIVNLQRSVVSTFIYKEGNNKIDLLKGHQTLLILFAHFNTLKGKNGASF